MVADGTSASISLQTGMLIMNKVLDSGDSSIDGNEARFHRMLGDIVELLGRIFIAGLFLFPASER